MPFHWCSDETFLLLSMLPFIGFFFKKLHAWWHKNSLHKCHDEHCDDVHVEHTDEVKEEKFDPNFDWDEVSFDLVLEKFGDQVPFGLRINANQLGLTDTPHENEFKWYLNSNGGLQGVLVHTRSFVYDPDSQDWKAFGLVRGA